MPSTGRVMDWLLFVSKIVPEVRLAFLEHLMMTKILDFHGSQKRSKNDPKRTPKRDQKQLQKELSKKASYTRMLILEGLSPKRVKT